MFIKTRIHRAVTAALFTSLGLGAGCAAAGSLEMEGIPAAMTDAEKRGVPASDAAQVNGLWESTGFTTLLRSSDEYERCDTGAADWPYGQLVDTNGAPLATDGSLFIGAPGQERWISNDNDFNSLVYGADGHLYLISHFEARPGAIYQTRLEQGADGVLTPQCTNPIDFSAVKGGWVHCAGSVTPWGTHLGSEEYEPDARSWLAGETVSAYNAQFSYYFGGDGSSDSAKATMNPYDYGYPVEITIDATGKATPTKHYAMGRMALELAYVMPDRKTAYMTDDGTNVGLFMFVADNEGDLSAGTLYAARWHQIEDTPLGGNARLSWYNLGHTDAAGVQAAIDGTGAFSAPVTFSDMFEIGAPGAAGGCADGTFTSINSGHDAPYHECLKLTGNVPESVVARLETRRYAAMKGATTEWRKMEGASYNPERRTLYLAMSDIDSGMLAGDTTDPSDSKHVGGNDHIAVTRNDCGAVYAMAVGGRVRDDQRQVIPSRYVARTMNGIVAGEPIPADADGNTCHLDKIASPDNISYLPKYDVLVIGEDTGSHQNDVVWAYHIDSGELTRIQSTPYGSETTSVYWYDDLGGHGYLMSVIQHPFGESDQGQLQNEDEKWGYVGYFQFPKLP
jgi:secreted PhoX family phosphatase